MARVLLIAGYAASLVRFRGPLIEALQRSGHEVHTAGPPADADTLEWLGARKVPFHTVPVARTSVSPIPDFMTFMRMASIMRSIRPDATFSYTIKPVIYGTLAAWFTGVARRYAMITGLGYAFTKGTPSIKRFMANRVARGLYRTSLRRAHAVIFQNPDDLAEFHELHLLRDGMKTALVNGSGVDLEKFAEAPLPPVPRTVMVGRVIVDKGVVEFLKAARIVKQSHPEAEFELVGPFEPGHVALPPGLLESAVADGIIVYSGELKDVRPAVAAANIFVLPSYREGQPRAVLEAMAMGRAVITTDAPGCRETVEHGVNGLLVPVADVQKLVEALTTLITDPAMRARMGRAGREIAVEKYEAGKVAASVLQACDLL